MELLIIVAIMAILFAMAVPGVLSGLDYYKRNATARDVHSELQRARLAAVSSNRPMRLRFNCPAVGQFRMVELIGTPATPDPNDSAGDRCDPVKYPYPAKDTNPLTVPNNDGPPRILPNGASFTVSQTIEFWPDGTAHVNASGTNPWPQIGAAAPTTITLTYKGKTKSITVNGVGKVQIQ